MGMTLANTACGVVPVFLPEGELGEFPPTGEKKEEEELVAAALGEGAGMGARTAAWPRGSE